MNFLNIGPMEAFVILIIALIVLGPERLPEVARSLGNAMRQLQQASSEFTSQLMHELQETEKGVAPLQDASRALEGLQEDIQRTNALPNLREGTEKATKAGHLSERPGEISGEVAPARNEEEAAWPTRAG